VRHWVSCYAAIFDNEELEVFVRLGEASG